MTTEISIFQGKAKIILRPENVFEEDLIQKVKTTVNYEIETRFYSDYAYGSIGSDLIEINLNEKERE